MKTITIKQPWASLIVEGIKDVENRTWRTKFRGRVLIHAGVSDDFYRHVAKIESNPEQFPLYRKLWEDGRTFLHAGRILGSVEIVDCVINHSSIWAEKSEMTIGALSMGVKPIYNWVLANPIKFPEPIPVKGKLSFWDYPNIWAEPEGKGGELFCHCQLSVKEKNQVSGDYRFGYYCRYCGGKWYK